VDPEQLADAAALSGFDAETIALYEPEIATALAREVAREVARAIVASDRDTDAWDDHNPFTARTYDELRALPVPPYIIADVLPAHRDAMLFGEACSGKTFVALDMLLCIANGVPWMGHEVPEPLDVALWWTTSRRSLQQVAAREKWRQE
jgi:RecA-family ATPase